MELAYYSVPTEPFREMTERYLAEHDLEWEDLSVFCGFDRTTLRKIFKNGSCRFDTIDKLLCMTYGPMIWQQPHLREIYWQGKPPPDDSKPNQCLECEEWFAPEGQQKYCSELCGERFRRKGFQRTVICAHEKCREKVIREPTPGSRSGAWKRQIYCSALCRQRQQKISARRNRAA